MYLKQLDIIGFKSFADKTRLTFEPAETLKPFRLYHKANGV